MTNECTDPQISAARAALIDLANTPHGPDLAIAAGMVAAFLPEIEQALQKRVRWSRIVAQLNENCGTSHKAGACQRAYSRIKAKSKPLPKAKRTSRRRKGAPQQPDAVTAPIADTAAVDGGSATVPVGAQAQTAEGASGGTQPVLPLLTKRETADSGARTGGLQNLRPEQLWERLTIAPRAQEA